MRDPAGSAGVWPYRSARPAGVIDVLTAMLIGVAAGQVVLLTIRILAAFKAAG
jgi:hypothetical protein